MRGISRSSSIKSNAAGFEQLQCGEAVGSRFDLDRFGR